MSRSRFRRNQGQNICPNTHENPEESTREQTEPDHLRPGPLEIRTIRDQDHQRPGPTETRTIRDQDQLRPGSSETKTIRDKEHQRPGPTETRSIRDKARTIRDQDNETRTN
ncbi:unnamed protein product [Pleuronectes platessa]|uniref:Uncharacterized protein n=1 Tax=Pleuronectes platessa TaxID=8262 RepID=A0A9N7U1N5_PLEPL|nr:unnamed protein product [Pleuronectes platessa]